MSFLKMNSKIILALLVLALLILWRYLTAIYPTIVAFSFFGSVSWISFCFLLSCSLLIYLLPKFTSKIKFSLFILIFLLSVVSLFVIEIKIPIRIERYLARKDYDVRIGCVTGKYKVHGRRASRDYYIGISVNSKHGQLDVKKEDYKKLNVGDTILLKVSSRGGIYIHNLFPTHKEIECHKVPQHFINGKLQECESDSVR